MDDIFATLKEKIAPEILSKLAEAFSKNKNDALRIKR